MTDDAETCTVLFEVTAVHEVKAGKLWLVDVALEIAGVPMTLAGCRAGYAGQTVGFEPPCSRLPSGEWVPAVDLPRELMSAIAQQAWSLILPGRNFSELA